MLLYFRDMSMKPNEKHSLEDTLSEDKIIDILKNVQSGPIAYSKVKLKINFETNFSYLYVQLLL